VADGSEQPTTAKPLQGPAGVFALLGGRKCALTIAAMLILGVLTALGRIEQERALASLNWLVGIGVGSIGVEDVFKQLKGGGK